MPEMTLQQVADALVAAGIAGPHASHARRANISKIYAMLDDDVEARFGLSGIERYSAAEVLGFAAELTGCSADIAEMEAEDSIDPARTVAQIVAAAERLAASARRGEMLLVVTGHPTGLLEHHIRVADAYQRAGGKLIRLREGEELGLRGRSSQVRYNGGVGCLSDWGTLKHTHSSAPMEALLQARPHPDIVLGDHGFAGAAIEAGIPTIAVMDINDPALAVAAAEGRDVVVIPMDDNRPPRLYEPSWRVFEAVLAGRELLDA